MDAIQIIRKSHLSENCMEKKRIVSIKSLVSIDTINRRSVLLLVVKKIALSAAIHWPRWIGRYALCNHSQLY